MSSIIPESVPPEYPLLYFLLDYKQRENDKEFVDRILAVQDASLVKPGAIAQLSWCEDLSVENGDYVRCFFEFPPQQIDRREWEDGKYSSVAVWCGESVLYGKRNKPDREVSTIQNNGTCKVAIQFEKVDIDGLNLHEATSAIAYKYHNPGEHRSAFSKFAESYFSDNDNTWRVTSELLERNKPRFVSNYETTFTDAEDLCEIISKLDSSYFTVQGPPGTGKTFQGARMIHHLLQQGKRVGITSQSWDGIRNLYDAVLELFQGNDNYTTTCGGGQQRPLPADVADERDPPHFFSDHDLVAWTTHFWAKLGNANYASHEEENKYKFDYLFIDEAGQLSLYDALVASLGARNVILLGDSQQLPQVTISSHEFGAGASILEHIAGEATTIPEEMGLLLNSTRRMRPEICSFISEEFYDGRLTPVFPATERCIEFANGLRWVNASHASERVDHSPEEVEKIIGIISAIKGGKKWVDFNSHTNQIEEGELSFHDFMIIAPYNRQRIAIQNELLDKLKFDGMTEEIAQSIVGTVDKFQGKEAPVVIYSMTTSNEDCIPAGREDFIFKPNRLNVAVSRAQCLAIVLANEKLVDTRTNKIRTMEHLNHLCRYFSDEGVASRLEIAD